MAKFKENTVEEWIEEINRGLDYRKQYGIEDSWSRLEALFYNVHNSQAHSGPNLIMSTGDALMSSLNVPYPYITVKARRADYLMGSKVQENIDNMLIEDLDLVSEANVSTLSAYLWGVGIWKIGYDSEYGWDPQYDYGLITDQPIGATLTQFSRQGRRIEFGKAESGMPWVSAVLPHDFVVPWGTRELEFAPWTAHRVIRHIDDVKDDPKYSTRGLQPCMSMADFVKSYESTLKTYRIGQELTSTTSDATGCVEFVEMWEIHDRRTGKIYVIATGHDEFLRNDQDLIGLEIGHPFVSMHFVPRARNFWTTPDAYYLENVQAELADITIQATKQRRSGVLKFIYGEDAFDEDELEKLLSADVGVAVKAKISATDLRNAIIPFSANPNNQLQMDMEMTRRNAREMIGLSRNQFGEFDASTRRTATEAQIVNQSSNTRMDRRQAALARLYTRTFSKINPLLWKFWKTPQTVNVIGQDGQPMWLQVVGEMIKGEYKYNVGFSTAPAETIQSRRQQAFQMYMSLRQDPLIDPIGLAKFLNMQVNDTEFSDVFNKQALSGQGAAQGQAPGGAPNGMGAGQAGAIAAPAGGGGGQPAENSGGPV